MTTHRPPVRRPTAFYLLSVRDLHPAARTNVGQPTRTDPVGQGLNHWPHLTQREAERHANELNRWSDSYVNVYVTRVEQ